MPEVVLKPEAKVDPAEKPKDGSGTEVKVSTEAKQEEKLILGKFKDHGELEKAYTELETKLGAKKEDAPVAPTAEAARKVVTDAGLDMSDLSREVAEKGELSKDSLTKLEAKGIKKETVDAFISGQKALAEKLTSDVQSVVGGAENYGKMLDWAQANMNDAQVGAFNEAIHSGNTDLAKLAVKGLLADFSAAVGVEGKMVTGDRTPSVTGVKPFASRAEIVAAMSDVRYKQGMKQDPAYVKEVERRIAVSNL